VNYLLPLITIPYLVRVIGIEKYGLIAFAMAFNYFFIVVSNYGFHLSATHAVSVNRTNDSKLSELFSSVMLLKSILMLSSFAILLLVVMLVPKLSNNYLLFCIMFLSVVGNVIFPRWYLLGLEQVNIIMMTSLAGKLITIIPIFYYVRSPSDYLMAAAFLSSSEVIAGICALLIIANQNQIRLVIPSVNMLRHLLYDGFYIFISQVAVTGVTGSNLFILGLFANPATIGSFALAEKIIKSATGLVGPISEAIYPRVGLLFHESRDKALKFLRKVAVLGGSLFLFGCCCLFFGSNIIIFLIAGESIAQASLMLQIMAVIPLSVFLDNIYGTQILLNIDMKKAFMNIIIVSGIFSLTCGLIFIPLFQAYACAYVFLVSEVLILLLMMFAVRWCGISPFTFVDNKNSLKK